MIASIDPGISGTGIALWNKKPWEDRRLVIPCMCRNIYANKKGASMIDRINSILEAMGGLFDYHEVQEAWMELPTFHNSASGHMVAKAGDLSTLTCMAGAVIGLCWSMDIELHVVTPNEWKGQLDKEQVIRKIKHILPNIEYIDPKSHSYDAIGIGLWAQGFYKR